MVQWKKVRIQDIGTVVGGATPSTKIDANYKNGHISWITPKDLSTFEGRYIYTGERNITEMGLNSSSTVLMPKNSILFSSRAPIGYVAIAGKELCTNQGFKSVIPNKKIDYLFLYYSYVSSTFIIKLRILSYSVFYTIEICERAKNIFNVKKNCSKVITN